MTITIHPTYFPNIAHFTGIVKAKNVVFEAADNYVKQTYRNRCYIYGANGKLALHIPVVFSQKNRKLYQDVKIFNGEKWQLQHWKSLESAYRTSPFFEFYQDELKPLFFEEATYLFEFNLKCFAVICECLQLDISSSKTDAFNKNTKNGMDLRDLVNVKYETPKHFTPYTQVFDKKHGFLPNLSILDLLFNEGPNSLNYLESQSIDY